jgi:hypothetical protein
MTLPIRGVEHNTHGIYIGDGKIRDDWKLPGNYRYTSQRCDEKYVAKIERNLIERRDNIHERKFEGTLENGSAKELDKDQFIRALIQKVREHEHESFFAIEKTNGKVYDLLKDHHIFKVTEAIDSYERRVHPTITGDYSYEEIERDDLELSQLVVESLLSEEIRDKMKVRYDHGINFYDYPGGVLVMMAFEISNASVSYDIEGAQVKLDELNLSNYPGEDVSKFCSEAHKKIKVMQRGYALPIQVGSKLLMKCTKTECEYFKRKVFDRLDKVKDMGDKYKLSGPASIKSRIP